MKRFLLFGYEVYEALGGWEDFQGAHSTAHSAKKAADEIRGDDPSMSEFHIVDLNVGEIILVLDGNTDLWRKPHDGEF